MARVFSERHKFEIWLRIELAVAEGWVREGRIPSAAFKRLRSQAKFNLRLMRQFESKYEHEVVCFLATVGHFVGELSRYLHLGLTSSDVMDTALSIQMQEGWKLLTTDLSTLTEDVGKLALKHKRTLMMGRTHGIHAEPITFGLKALVWYEELKRAQLRLERAREETAVGKLSGSVGNYAHIPPRLEEWTLSQLGLKPAPVTNQIIQRDRHAAALTSLAILGGTLEKIAVGIRNLQRTEIGELAEPFMSQQKGSSSMPHKRNPILCERMSGLARLLRGYAHVALENQPLWDERDISHSSAERVIVPDSFIVADYMLAKMRHIIEGLQVNAKRMEENIYATKGLIFSQRLLLALAEKGLSREEAYALVQQPALKAYAENRNFYSMMKESREVRKYLSLKELSDIFSLDAYVTHVDDVFQRAGLQEAKPAGRRRPRGGSRRGRTHRGGAKK